MKLNINSKRTNPYAEAIDNTALIVAACIMAWYYYGAIALKLVLFTCFSAVIADAVTALILKAVYKPAGLPLNILGAVFSGAFTALLCPAAMPLFLPPIMIFVAIIAAKAVYPILTKKPTTFSRYELSAPVIAVLLLSVVFSKYMFSFAIPSAPGSASPIIKSSVLSLLKSADTDLLLKIDFINVLTGNIVSPIGCGCFLLMISALIYIIIRKKAYSVMTVTYILGIVFMAVLNRRAGLTIGKSILFELTGGTGLFIAVFILSDKKIQPANIVLKAVFGFAGGILTMLLRYIGIIEDSACVAALIMNIAALMINRSKLFKKKIKKYSEA